MNTVEGCNLIYPLDVYTKLGIKVLRFELSQQMAGLAERLNDVYCILNYNYGKTKLSTQTRSSGGLSYVWQQEFAPVDISAEPSDMKLKIYNKRYKSIRDQYMGDIEVLITTADRLKLPVFDKQGAELGSLTIQLTLQQCPPPPLLPQTPQEQTP